jgi:hypothetical protein
MRPSAGRRAGSRAAKVSIRAHARFHRFPKEAAIIGRLLAGYGEIDFTFALMVVKICGDEDTILRAIFRMRTEAGRISLADTLVAPCLEPFADLFGHYSHALGCVRFCLTLRNQYAHCHWNDHDEGGLFFTNLEEAAKPAKGFNKGLGWSHVDVPLLTDQENFFIHTRRCLWHIESEYLVRTGKFKYHPHEMPKQISQPMKHNPPDEHPWPPWSASTEGSSVSVNANAGACGPSR